VALCCVLGSIGLLAYATRRSLVPADARAALATASA